MSVAINIENLNFAYPQKKSITDVAPLVLNIPKWQVDAGKRVFLHGPSGSGKSTLLNLLSGTLSLSVNAKNSAVLSVLGQPLQTFSNRKKDEFRAKSLGVVFQQLNLIGYLSVLDNIKLASLFSQKAPKFDNNKLKQVLTNLNLSSDVLYTKASDLSVGQQQRVAIARALYHKPSLLIVDEPTSALDLQSTTKFMQLLLDNTQQLNATLLFVSHDMRLAKDFDQCIALDDINQACGNNPCAHSTSGENKARAF
jgi:putative ABC transport system ATP-binding protein